MRSSSSIILALTISLAHGSPTQGEFSYIPKYFDVQGHRGSRGEAIENTLPAFAWGLIDGVTTLELDNGITKDNHVVVWHDEEIIPEKCRDTNPVVNGDPDFPYVGKHVADLTLAQLKTLDCGSKRHVLYPLQLTYPGTKISTLDEVFEFANCADPEHNIQWNIESKIDAADPSSRVDDFVTLQHQSFLNSGYKLSQITYQSFDWRTLVSMKAVEPQILTSALIENEKLYGPNHSVSRWHAGLSIGSFPGDTIGHKIAHAAHAIGADILSPDAVSSDRTGIDQAQTYVPFATWEMIQEAHRLGLLVKPWTVNHINIAQQLIDWGVDGLISDYPTQIRRLIQEVGKPAAPKFPRKRVLDCLDKYLQKVS